jgi:hypothetical protein
VLVVLVGVLLGVAGVTGLVLTRRSRVPRASRRHRR